MNNAYMKYLEIFAFRQQRGSISSREVPMTEEEYTHEVIECEWCGEEHERADMNYVNGGDFICEDCMVDHSTECESCNSIIHEDDSCNGLCEHCRGDLVG